MRLLYCPLRLTSNDHHADGERLLHFRVRGDVSETNRSDTTQSVVQGTGVSFSRGWSSFPHGDHPAHLGFQVGFIHLCQRELGYLVRVSRHLVRVSRHLVRVSKHLLSYLGIYYCI